MKFYLRIINPVLALIVLGLCTWAAILDDGKFELLSEGLIKAGIKE